nr:immunoglobulin heavy chain junction region [Macaca mulatta]MPN69403.1 immunoglobulin heavy chain junction region [Macaca mulatta]MPN69687.1 immunoglobulin heavy chain junction region [Macaca mulatta]MPN69844.1 immunoglobulin heavy chain junction region [Macaca mulatta]MPN69880.1 immunoglobulin heavy chain junction region [Macaca mulatta]
CAREYNWKLDVW